MKKKKNNQISAIFIVCITLVIIGSAVYLTQPVQKGDAEKKPSFEDMLEVSTPENNNPITYNSSADYNSRYTSTKQRVTNNDYSSRYLNTKQSNTNTYKPTNIQNTKQTTKQSFENILEDLKTLPSYSISSVSPITSTILKYKGYRGDEVKIINEIQISSAGKAEGTTTAAYFDINSGTLHINQSLISKLDIKETVAIIAHELDHFDNVAKLCKSMGYENFIRFTESNNIFIQNKEFWANVCTRADITNFKQDLYKDALIRLINQNRANLTSIYADFYRISEYVRNPFEISAYEVSDYILRYYNYPTHDSLSKQLSLEFNKADWQTYNITNKDYNLRNERIAIFDYVLAQAIMDVNPHYRDIYNKCINNNGNLTEFWQLFKNDYQNFFNKTKQIDADTYQKVLTILNRMVYIGQADMPAEKIAEAIKYSVYTMLSNRANNENISKIKQSAEDYLSYTSKYKIYSSADELRMMLILINIENISDKKQNNNSSLYYIKIPEYIERHYPDSKKNPKFNFLYKNPEFIKVLEQRKLSNPNITEQELLTELLKKTASEIK